MNTTFPEPGFRSIRALVVWFIAVNVPFAVGHPAGASFEWPLLRSLAINSALLLGPGWAWMCARGSRDRPSPWTLLASIVISTVVFVALLGLHRLWQRPPTAGGMWNATWLITNVVFLAGCLRRRTAPSGAPVQRPVWLLACGAAAAAYALYFWGATRVVPPQEDHDLEVQGTGYALLHRLEPLLLTDRGTDYYFAHPPLLHIYAAGAFLYFDEVAHLKRMDDASRRSLAARQGRPVEVDPNPVRGVRILEAVGSEYLVQVADRGVTRIPIERMELQVIWASYAAAPHRLETRTPTLFFAAGTVSLLVFWLVRLTGAWLVPLLAATAYATSPEVFARSSYGGYFGITNIACLAMLISAAEYDVRKGWDRTANCVLAGAFAALANHKLVFLPLALGLCQLGFRPVGPGPNRWARRVHPTLIGFIGGSCAFWVYGLLIDAAEFWKEHVRTHLLDRLAQINPLGYVGYPSAIGLWTEFWQHTGYVLLPVGLACLFLLAVSRDSQRPTGDLPARTYRAWLVWFVVTAAAFSVVDWRMTKHLMPLVLMLTVAVAVWGSAGRWRRIGVAALFTAVIGWNVIWLVRIAADFESFHVTPAW